MTRTPLAAALILTAILATGCDDSIPAAASPGAASASPSPSPATPTPSPIPTAQTPFTLGAPWEWENTSGSLSGATTAVGYQQNVAKSGPSPEEAFGEESHGYVWAALEVKVCSDATSSETTTASDSSWQLAYDDGSIVEPSSSGYESFPKPKFPFGGADLMPGRCVAGKIVFPVPGDKKPARALYAPASIDVPREWQIP